jgi:hypothetical protein
MLNAGYEPFVEVVNNDEQLKTFLSTSEIYFSSEGSMITLFNLILFHSNNFIK